MCAGVRDVTWRVAWRACACSRHLLNFQVYVEDGSADWARGAQDMEMDDASIRDLRTVLLEAQRSAYSILERFPMSYVFLLLPQR